MRDLWGIIIIIIIIIKKDGQCKAGRGRLTPYQSEDPSHTYQPIEEKKKKENSWRQKRREQPGQHSHGKMNASKTKTKSPGRTQCIPSHPYELLVELYWRSQMTLLYWEWHLFPMTFEKHLRSVSGAASQRLGIMRKSWRVFDDGSLLGRCFRGFVLPVLEYFLQRGARPPIHTLN